MPWWDIIWYYRSETAPSVEVLGADEGSCISQRGNIAMYYLSSVSPALKPERDKLANLKKQLADLKPSTTVLAG